MVDNNYVDMFPQSISIDLEGTTERTLHTAKTLVPPTEIGRIVEAVTRIIIPDKDVLKYLNEKEKVFDLTSDERDVAKSRREHNKIIQLRKEEDTAPCRQAKDAWRNQRLLKI